MAETTSSVTTETRTTRRYWRRTDKPAAWWPWGLLPVLGIFLLWLLGGALVAPAMERQIREDVTSRLADYPVTSVVADGQDVRVTLAEADESTMKIVQAIARATDCPSWAGELNCPIQVSVTAEHEATGEHHSAEPDPVAVETADTVMAEPAEPVAPVAIAETRDRCNERFADVLSQTTIQFETGSARIATSNDRVLTEIVQIASACPGKLIIEGHTDAVGSQDNNLALSQARASAVRYALAERGLSADRMEAFGFGESRPIADNVSAAGRAKNRRIVIRISDN